MPRAPGSIPPNASAQAIWCSGAETPQHGASSERATGSTGVVLFGRRSRLRLSWSARFRRNHMVEQLVGRRALLALGLGLVGCGLIPEPKGFVKMKAKGPGDEKAKVIYERHFEGWSEMFDTMNEA